MKGKPVDKQYTKPEKFDFKLSQSDKERVWRTEDRKNSSSEDVNTLLDSRRTTSDSRSLIVTPTDEDW